ncbi:MAG: amino acid permease, partial [Clostridia bacterium]|nr:amino acid permease [Clostridia bacterium]
GLMLGCSRGIYSLASRGRGPAPHVFSIVDKHTNMPTNSSVMGLLLCGAWLLFFYCSQLSGISEKLGMFAFDPTELPIVTIYPFYIPIFFKMMKIKELKGFQRFVSPVLAIIGSVVMVVAAFQAHGKMIPGYLIIFAVVMAIGLGFMKKKEI